MKTINLVLLLVLVLLIPLLFQNCTAPNFSGMQTSRTVSSTTGGGGGTVLPPSDLTCLYDGINYRASDAPIETYIKSVVPAGETCQKFQSRCNPATGVFSPTPGFKTCSVLTSPPVSLGLYCVRREAGIADPPEFLPSLPHNTDWYRDDIYEKFSDGTYKLKEKCSLWQSTKPNPGLNCGAKISGTSGADIGSIITPITCCETGRVSINGLCETENDLGGYCYAASQCKAGQECTNSKCVLKGVL